MDVKTLFLSNIMVAAFLTAAMLYYMFIQKTYKGFGWWTASTGFACISYLIMLLRIFFEGPLADIITIIIANTCIASVLIVRLQGVKKFFGKKSISGAYLFIPAFMLLVFYYFYSLLSG